MSKVTKGVSFLLQVTIFVGFLILLTSIITSFYLSKKLYSPIKNLLNLFNNSEINNSEVGNEVICIENSITTLINKNVNLENILKEYDRYLKDKFLQNLIHNKALDECIVAEKLQQYKINLNLKGSFFCYVISIDDTSEHIENNVEKQQSLLYIYLSEISNKVIFSKYKGFITELNDNNICIVINIDQNTEDKDTFYNLASDIHSLIQENIHYSVTIGKSDVNTGISSLPVCYQEAVAAVNYRLFTGYNQIIFYEKLHINQSTGMSYPFNLERNIISSLKMSRRDSVMSSLKEFINFIYSNPTNDYTVVKHHFLQLLCATIKCLYEMDRNFELVTLTGENIYSKILSVKTVGEAEICFNNLFNSVLNYTENQRNEQNKELIQSITTYIKDNLNKDLSIDSLATAFYISSSYLRKIFKEEIGITIKDYVDNERINKAKHLLQDTNNKISTIGENVGYTTVQTFVRAFKLQTGKTPGEYRTENVIKAKISL
jgi:YesN/AraC family two-component response regulator